MDKKTKRQLTILGIVMAIIAIVICILLNTKPNENIQENYIDTSDIKETTINWEEVVNVDISGFVNDVNAEITYNEIPDLLDKISNEETKYNEKRLSQELSDEEKQAYDKWITELRNTIDGTYCNLPADINTKTNGDVIKVTCGSKTLEKLNYKFNDGFEITLSGLLTKKDNAVVEAEQKAKAEYEEKVASGLIDEKPETTIIEEDVQENVYTVVGNDIIISVTNLETAKLNQVKSEDQKLIIVVNNDEDFEKVKEYALENGNIDFIQNDEIVYDKESNFTEGEEWKGITLEQ